ncbi:MAG: hypothetical protein RLY35_1551 [Bacteroidota bacterium]
MNRILNWFCFLMVSGLWGFFVNVHGQKFPDNFSSPLEIPLSLSGSFGELRQNHFHSGWDIQTQEKEGLKVMSIADGYVSRIKVSAKGYGNVVYITHPQYHLVSVYGHLSQFKNSLADEVYRLQYEKQSFELDVTFEPNQFHIVRGEEIGKSGNSGSSGGPHLHFEIRNQFTEKTIDPSLYGFKVADISRPLIEFMSFIPKGSFDNVQRLDFHFAGESFGREDTLYEVPDTFGVALQVKDFVLDVKHPTGIKQIITLLDGNIISELLLDSLDFNQTKDVNAHVFYPEWSAQKANVHRCYRLPNAPQYPFIYLEKDGWVHIKDTMVHAITCLATDFSGNATCVFAFIKKKKDERVPSSVADAISWKNGGQLKSEDWTLSIPSNALYEDTPLNLQYRMKRKVQDGQFKVDSLLFSITPPTAFAHKIYLSNESKDWKDMPDSLKAKMGLVKVDEEGSWIGWNKEKDGMELSKSGQYLLVEDVKAPKVVDVDRTKGSILVSDDWSGVKRYRAKTAEDAWVLLRFDQKNNLLYWDTKKTKELKAENLKIELEDYVGNQSAVIIPIQ